MASPRRRRVKPETNEPSEIELSLAASNAEIDLLQQRISRLKKGLYAAVAVSILSFVVVCIAAFSFDKLLTETRPPDTAELELRLLKAENQLAKNAEMTTAHQAEIATLMKDLENGKGQQDRLRIDAIKQVLLNQQKDQQLLLNTLQQGMIDLANMVKGTRDWTNTYVKGINKAKSQTSDRTKSLNDV